VFRSQCLYCSNCAVTCKSYSTLCHSAHVPQLCSEMPLADRRHRLKELQMIAFCCASFWLLFGSSFSLEPLLLQDLDEGLKLTLHHDLGHLVTRLAPVSQVLCSLGRFQKVRRSWAEGSPPSWADSRVSSLDQNMLLAHRLNSEQIYMSMYYICRRRTVCGVC
jgi:hypothetical protein